MGVTDIQMLCAISNSYIHIKNSLMKRLATKILFIITFYSSAIAQESNLYSLNQDNIDKGNLIILANLRSNNLNSDNDSIWSFYFFSVKVSPGIWFPIGQLSKYYNPSLQLGFSLDMMISHRMRLEYGIYPRFMNNKQPLLINYNDSIIKTNTPMSGSIGGWISYELIKNKFTLTEIISGFSWEPLDTETENPNPKNNKDTKLSVSKWGFSIGQSTWFNIFGKQNIGLRTMYQYAAYDSDRMLISKLGGHSFSISLVYRYPKRDDAYIKYH